MLAPNLTPADFLYALQALMPSGKAWPRDPAATLTAVLNGLAATFAAQTSSANGLITDAFPATTVNLLTEWQSTLAQPDPAGPTPATLSQAQQFVKAKFGLAGGQCVQSFLDFATAYGLTIAVDVRAPFRAGQSRCGQQIGGQDWFFGWYIHMPAGQAAYEGLLAEVAPAHTVLNFILT